MTVPEMITINDDNYLEFVSDDIEIGGEKKARGLNPRNYALNPVGYCRYAKPFDLPLIPESERQAALDEMIARKARLSDCRATGMDGSMIPSRDQNGKGYCWAHSSTSASLLVRASNGMPYADLSAYAVACIIKGFRDEGGWAPRAWSSSPSGASRPASSGRRSRCPAATTTRTPGTTPSTTASRSGWTWNPGMSTRCSPVCCVASRSSLT